MELHPKLRDELQAGYQKLLNTGELKSKDALAGYYSLFRQRFGPEVLRNTDGEELLALIKGFGRDALIYWLEFKDDDEFPASFGSIAGGSALKYAVYKRNDTSAWMTGSPSQQRDVPVSEAVRIAQSHRDQLLAACRLLEALPIGADDDRYASLQTQLREVAPDVEDTAWGHKYLSLLYPTKLEDFHVYSYQRHSQIRLLQIPPLGVGRYLSAGRFVSLAETFGWPMNDLTRVLNDRNGPPRRYWRIGTSGDDANYWELFRSGSADTEDPDEEDGEPGPA